MKTINPNLYCVTELPKIWEELPLSSLRSIRDAFIELLSTVFDDHRQDMAPEVLEHIARQDDYALSAYRKALASMGTGIDFVDQDRLNQDRLKVLFKVCVLIARKERQIIGNQNRYDHAHWLNWPDSSW